MRKRIWIAAMVLLLAGSGSGRAQGDRQLRARPDYPRALEFLHHMQEVLRRDDRPEMARLIKYPITAATTGGKITVATPEEFVASFDRIIDPGVRCELLGAKDDDLWGNLYGITVGKGTVWFKDFFPKGTTGNIDRPGFWATGTFLIAEIHPGSANCKAG